MAEQGMRNIAAVGAGRVGQGMALEFAVGGHSVTIHEVSDAEAAWFPAGIGR
jgi:predicted dinucleotide-binding enzyme